MKIKKLLFAVLLIGGIIALGFVAKRIWVTRIAQQKMSELPAFYNPED